MNEIKSADISVGVMLFDAPSRGPALEEPTGGGLCYPHTNRTQRTKDPKGLGERPTPKIYHIIIQTPVPTKNI